MALLGVGRPRGKEYLTGLLGLLFSSNFVWGTRLLDSCMHVIAKVLQDFLQLDCLAPGAFESV